MSITHLELIAISRALTYIKLMNSNKFVILTDSRSALQHVARCSSYLRGTPIAYEIIKSIEELTSLSKEVILQWIPSHIGLTGNDEVDILAKQACTDGDIVNDMPFFTDCLHLIKIYCSDMWKTYFDERSVEKGIWYRTIQNDPCRIPWFDECKLSRNMLTTAFRLRSGHIPLNKFAYLMKKVPSPLCTECGIIEDAVHIMVECVRNEDIRNDMLLISQNFKELGCCNSILAYPLSEPAKLLYKVVIIGMRRRPH